MPDWIERAPFPASTREGEKRIIDYALVNDELALLWMANMGCIDMNAWCVARRPARPARLGHVRPRPVRGLELRGGRSRSRCSSSRPLDLLGLESFPKTSRLARDPRARADRAAPRVRGGARVRRRSSPARSRARTRASRRPSGRRRSAAACSSTRTRTGPGRRRASVYSVRPRAGAPGLDAAALGRGRVGASTLHGVHDGRRARPASRARRPLRAACSAASSR